MADKSACVSRTDQTPQKQNADIMERREQEAKLEQHASIQPKTQKQKLTLEVLTFTRELWAQLSRQKRKWYVNWRNQLRRGEQPLKHPVKKKR